MKQWLEIQFADRVEKHELRADPENRGLGIVNRGCPGCHAFPLVLTASSPTIAHGKPDTMRANGHTKCCGDPVGYVYQQQDSLFGLEEDRAVLQFGRARVYGNTMVRL
jgi:hypothetical protein